jgi:MFS family permease
MAAAAGRLLRTFADEIGFLTLLRSPLDTKLLCIQRLVRFLAYGSTTLILALFLSALNIRESRIGLFMTLTLLGDVVISLVLTVVADGIGRRRMLALGALLMSASGVVFALTSNFWVLLAAAVFGVISPSGNEIGPFRAIEESVLAGLTSREERTGLLAWYTVFGYTGASLGVLVCGWILRAVQAEGWTPLESYRLVFWAYSGLGLVKFVFCLFLSEKCEPMREIVPVQQADDETRPLLANEGPENGHIDDTTKPDEVAKQVKGSILGRLLPAMSSESISLVWKLCLLFAVDSVASGLTPASWTTYFFATKFHLSEGKLGTLFFVTNVLSTISNFAAAPLARRIGLIKTMVFTHVPASISLALIPLPGNVFIAMALLALRYSTNSMDQAPRQAFLSAAVLPGERTAVMGVVNVVKTLSQSVGPVVTGTLAQKGLFWVAFIAAGSLKLLYDVLMLALFLGHRTVEERAEQRLAPAPASDIEQSNENSATNTQQ